jgi:F420-dependent oxidoreductase-like protein
MTTQPEVRFGMFLSQQMQTWAQTLDEFRLAEDLGFDHAWLVDHFVDTDGSPDLPCLEAWTLLAALAAKTSRIRLGVLVTSNTFRHPALLAKEAVTVDHVSGGRLILGLGTGWHEDEHRRFGIDLPPVGERVDRLEEAIQMIRGLTSQQRTTFAGRYYRLDDAPFQPRPVQAHIPLLIAAHRPRMLRLAARYADQWDTFATLPGSATDGIETPVAERIAALDAACAEIGRDPAEIRRSTWAGPEVYESADAFEDWVHTNRALGFTDFSIERPPADRHDLIERIARVTIPALRAEFAS